jgi:hypothetical protein
MSWLISLASARQAQISELRLTQYKQCFRGQQYGACQEWSAMLVQVGRMQLDLRRIQTKLARRNVVLSDGVLRLCIEFEDEVVWSSDLVGSVKVRMPAFA